VREYRASGRVVSFDLLSSYEGRDWWGSFESVLDTMTLERFLGALSPLELRIVRSIHLEGSTVVDLAKRLGYSRRHLTRLHRGAMTRLRSLGSNVSATAGYGH
jgi:hypothetical protein